MNRMLKKQLKPHHLEDENLVRLLEGLPPPPPIDPTDSRGGGVKLNEARQNWLCEFMSLLPSPKLAAEILGMSVSTIHKHRNQNPAFKAKYDEAATTGRTLAASLAYELAHGLGKSYEVVRGKDGAEVVTIPAKRSERMVELIYKLEHAPEFQRHTHDVNHSGVEPGSMVIQVTPEQLTRLSRSERKTLSQLLEKLQSFAPKTIDGVVQPAGELANEAV